MKFITKINIFFSFLVLLGIFIFLQWFRVYDLCSSEGAYNYKCGEILGYIKTSILIISALLLPSLFTLPFNPAVFERWKRFAVRAVPVTIVLTLLLILADEGGAYFSYGFSGMIIILLYAWFTLHSLTLIVYTAIKERKNLPVE